MSVSPIDENPVSKLFLSCDLTGSTAFKQRTRAASDTPWQKVFLQFYREFPQRLYSQQKSHDADDLNFELWKAVGDELIFTCTVTSEIAIFDAVEVWVSTLQEYKSNNLKEYPDLGVKGGVFLGTFPGPDHESTIPFSPDTETSGLDVVALNRDALKVETRDTSKYLFDYFGPSIDTGFRVINRCNERYLTLSVEVAYALVLVHQTPFEGKYKRPDLKLMDSMALKGVWGGRDYPVFAIDLRHSDDVNQAMSAIVGDGIDPEKIAALCSACYSSADWPFQMYLPESTLGRFMDKPVDPLAHYLENTDIDGIGIETRANDDKDSVSLREDAPTD